MDPNNLPPISLRRELVMCLSDYADAAASGPMPVLSPRGVLAALNDVGPEINERWLPLIEAALDSLWAEGLVGRIPAPSPEVPKGYCCRRFAERAIHLGAPIILLPRRGHRPRYQRLPLPTGDTHREET